VSVLRLKRGDTLQLAVGPVLKADGSVQDITGHTLRFSAKDRSTDLDNAAILSGAIGSGITITNGPAGLALVVIATAAVTVPTNTGFRVLLWDVQIADPAGVTRTLDSGKLIIERDVTQTSP
jgi:hypothetical protein